MNSHPDITALCMNADALVSNVNIAYVQMLNEKQVYLQQININKHIIYLY